MPIYTVKLERKENIADGTMAFYFEKPQGFVHTAGQYADLTLINPSETDAEGNVRTFTLANAPYEASLMFATRMRDTAFKRTLKNMPIGMEISLDAPHGTFTLHDDASVPAVFLTGGIGLTPARSIILQATHDKLPHRIFLFDSNKRPEDAVFLDELIDAQQRNPNYTFIGTMTQMEKSQQAWEGETGFIDEDMLLRYIDDLTVPIYYLVGPQGMVSAMLEMLIMIGVDEDNIRTE
ncbi:MAG TPA: FAD-dependent oxidoreductase, partial [Thiopseudomonas sp.]|nr:FAD-dependent oxidoreductase [Thiopseudomonas sp.]